MTCAGCAGESKHFFPRLVRNEYFVAQNRVWVSIERGFGSCLRYSVTRTLRANAEVVTQLCTLWIQYCKDKCLSKKESSFNGTRTPHRHKPREEWNEPIENDNGITFLSLGKTNELVDDLYCWHRFFRSVESIATAGDKQKIDANNLVS